ncbi:MAG: hypothetical protein IJT16_10220 [Lachnospiraceae bacterium]|nr:hypothetical protein [Lachnospiraceae bacterium]
MKRVKWVELSAFLYLYLPLVIFLFGWTKLWIALPVFLVTLAAIELLFYFDRDVIFISEQREAGEPRTGDFFGLKRAVLLNLVCAAVTLALCVLWCVASGLGGFVSQTADWYKHNVLLKDLLEQKPPIVYSFSGRTGVLSYYIADYLPAALFAGLLPKSLGEPLDNAELFLLVWVAIGIFISILVLYRSFGRGKGYFLPLIFFGVFLFGTFICPLAGLFRVWFPEETRDGVQWLSNTIWIQYSSNITLLSYVFPQFVSGLISSALFYVYRKKPEVWGLILAPLVLHSTFVFLGMAVLMGTVFLLDMVFTKIKQSKTGPASNRKPAEDGNRADTNETKYTAVTWTQYIRKLFSPWNLASLPVLAVLLIYILGNYLQSKPAGSAMSFAMIDYHGYFWTWFTFEAAWLLWVFLLLFPGRNGNEPVQDESEHEGTETAGPENCFRERNGDRELLLAVSISLFCYPFFTMGYYNDLCMRASIPALLVLCIMVVERMVGALTGLKPARPIFGGDRMEESRSDSLMQNLQVNSARPIFDGNRWYAVLLIICLLVTGLGPAKELTELYTSRNEEGKSYNAPYQNSEDFYMSNEFLQYQYIDWETDGIISLILKQENSMN